MKRCLALISALGLLSTTAAGTPQKSYSIKVRNARVGEAYRVQEESSHVNTFKVVDSTGKVLADETHKLQVSYVYRQTVLEYLEDGKTPKRLKRHYEKGERIFNEMKNVVPYQGKTVIIDKKEGKYHFSIEGGALIEGEAAQELDKEFNGPSNNSPESQASYLPPKEVKLNDSWQLDSKAISKEWKNSRVEFDDVKSKGSATLMKVYQRGEQLFGIIQVRKELISKASLSKIVDEKILPGSQLVQTERIDCCIDASCPDVRITGVLDLDATLAFTLPNGTEGKQIRRLRITYSNKYETAPDK
jgi:hypothetical protein